MGDQARLPLDLAHRRLPPTEAQQSITSQRHQNNSQDVEYPAVDHRTRAWESPAKLLAISCEHLKRQAIIPLLHWALSALGQPNEPAPTALPIPAPHPGVPQDIKSQAPLTEERAKIQSRFMELGKSLAEEKENHEKVRLRCLQLEKNLDEAKKQGEKLKLRCTELERNLAEDEEKRRKQTNMEARMKRARDELLAEMERILKDSKNEDDEYRLDIERLRAGEPL